MAFPEEREAVALEILNTLVIFGDFTGSTELQRDSTLSTTQLISTGFIDSYLAKYGIDDGNLLDVKQLGGTEAQVAGQIKFLPPPNTDEAILTGASSGAVKLPPFVAPPICGTATLRFPQGSYDFYAGRIPVFPDSSTAVSPEIEALPLQAYPNPVGEFLSLAYSQSAMAGSLLQISIYDISGRRVQTQALEPRAETQEISVVNLPKGMYLIQVTNKSGRRFSSRFVKE